MIIVWPQESNELTVVSDSNFIIKIFILQHVHLIIWRKSIGRNGLQG